MGITADVGQDSIDRYHAVLTFLNLEDTDDWDIGYGWCDEHCNNTLCGMCSCCTGFFGFPETVEEEYKRIIDWLGENDRLNISPIMITLAHIQFKKGD